MLLPEFTKYIDKIIWYIVIIAILINLTTEQDFYSKFFQDDYQARNQRFQLPSKNPKFFNRFDVVTFKHNRTFTANNFTIICKEDISTEKIVINVQVYRLMSNEYRLFPIRFNVDFSKAVENNLAGFGTIYRCGNFENVLVKGRPYSICNFSPDVHRLPPRIPDGFYKCQFAGMYAEQSMFILEYYLEIYRPVKTKEFDFK